MILIITGLSIQRLIKHIHVRHVLWAVEQIVSQATLRKASAATTQNNLHSSNAWVKWPSVAMDYPPLNTNNSHV